MKTTNQTNSAPPGQTTMPKKIQRRRMVRGVMLAAMFHALPGLGTEAMAADVVLAQARADFSSVNPANGDTTNTWGGGLGIPDTYGRPPVSSNGCGHWNYYQSDNANPTLGALGLLSWQSIGNAGNSGYGGTATWSGFKFPCVGASKIFGDGAAPAADQVTWHPYVGGQPYAVLRWTAGAAESGLIKIEGAIDRTLEGGNGYDSFAVFVNGVSQFSVASLHNGESSAFSFSLTVSAGQNVDFVLGANSFAANEAKLSATISVPGQDTVTYDADPGTAGAQDGAGAGWDGNTANWWDGSNDVAWPGGTAYEAIIGAGSGAAGIIAVTGTQTLNKLTFNAPGSGTYTLSGGTLSFGGTLPTITGTADATISSILAGTAGLTKTGTNTVTLSGVNTYSGDTLVSEGKITVAAGGSIDGTTGSITTRGGGIYEIAGSVTMGANQYVAAGNGASSTTGEIKVLAGGSLTVGNGAFLIGGSTINNNLYGNGTFTISGGTVSIAAGGGSGPDTSTIWLNPYDYDSTRTATLNLDGGVFTTARRIANGAGGASQPAAIVNFDGGTLKANLADLNFFFTNGAPLTLNIRNGGAIIDSNGQDVIIDLALAHSNIGGDAATDGGLTKTGNGTLTLSAANTYTGNTTVNAGTLSITHACLADASTVTIASAARLDLNFGAVSDTVAKLIIGTTVMPVGIYGATDSGATTIDDTHFAGVGTLTVTTGPTGGSDYATWAHYHAGDGAPSDDYNNDGVSNGVAYFMDATGVATNPGVVDNTVTWPYLNAVTSFEVQVSDDLVIWTPAPSGVVTVLPPGGHVTYTLPTGPGITKKFCRLMVMP